MILRKNMKNIFSTNERIRILKDIIFSNKPIGVNTVASKLKVSKGLVSKYLDVLSKGGITRRSKGKYIIVNSAITKGIRILINLADIDIKIFKKFDFVEAAGLYGSCTKGENTEDSDMDIWIKTKEISDDKVAPLTAEMHRKIRNIKPLFLTSKKIEKMKKADKLFYHSLSFGSIILYGEKDAV